MSDESKSTGQPTPTTLWRAGLDLFATLVVITAASAVLWRAVQAPRPNRASAGPPLPRQPISLGNAPTVGDPHASLAMIVYSDFECPYCGRFARDTWPSVRAKYVDRGRLLVAFKQYPLQIHAHAELAARSAVCASTYGRFWQMHDLIFSHQSQLDLDRLTADALVAGIGQPQFNQCLEGPARGLVAGDIAEAKALGISTTPTFMIGRLEPGLSVDVVSLIVGARPVSDFEAGVERAFSR